MPSSTGSSLRATACEKPSPKYPGLTAPDRHEPINPPTGAAARDQSERCPRSIGITARNHRNTHCKVGFVVSGQSVLSPLIWERTPILISLPPQFLHRNRTLP